MEKAKIHLSANEWKMIRETDWIFVKKQINLKVFELLGSLAAENRIVIPSKTGLPEEVRLSEPKITKGEQYKDLPYILLDYPKVFGREGVFAVRTIFLWGKQFSVTLHLSGKYKQQYESAFIKNYLPKQNHYCCFESFCSSEWEHEVVAPYYLPTIEINSDQLAAYVRSSTFMKLGIPFSLDEWDLLPEKLLKAHQTLLEWMD